MNLSILFIYECSIYDALSTTNASSSAYLHLPSQLFNDCSFIMHTISILEILSLACLIRANTEVFPKSKPLGFVDHEASSYKPGIHVREPVQLRDLRSPHAPTTTACPSGSPLVRGATGIDPREATYIAARRIKANRELAQWLTKIDPGFPTANLSS